MWAEGSQVWHSPRETLLLRSHAAYHKVRHVTLKASQLPGTPEWTLSGQLSHCQTWSGFISSSCHQQVGRVRLCCRAGIQTKEGVTPGVGIASPKSWCQIWQSQDIIHTVFSHFSSLGRKLLIAHFILYSNTGTTKEGPDNANYPGHAHLSHQSMGDFATCEAI